MNANAVSLTEVNQSEPVLNAGSVVLTRSKYIAMSDAFVFRYEKGGPIVEFIELSEWTVTNKMRRDCLFSFVFLLK